VTETLTLEAMPRMVRGKQVRALRREKLIPAVIYGLGNPVIITVPYRPLEVALQKAGSTRLINVTVDGQVHNTLVREVQRTQLKREIMHVDFLSVDLTKKLRVEVSVHVINVPKLDDQLFISHDLATITVECLPSNIPSMLELNGKSLSRLDARLTVADLPKLEGVEYLDDPTAVVARVASTAAVEETEEEGAAEPEVIEKGKKEEEGE
jgi:large subunit ribosomal protein L25